MINRDKKEPIDILYDSRMIPLRVYYISESFLLQNRSKMSILNYCSLNGIRIFFVKEDITPYLKKGTLVTSR